MAVPLDILARRGGARWPRRDGGDGSVRWCCGERDRGRGREQRVRERSEELRGVVVASPGGAPRVSGRRRLGRGGGGGPARRGGRGSGAARVVGVGSGGEGGGGRRRRGRLGHGDGDGAVRGERQRGEKEDGVGADLFCY